GTRAVDASVHDGLDQRADMLVLDGALVLPIAGRINAIGHGLVLQIALPALIADRAIERVVDQQEFHHAFTGLFDHGRVGEHFRRFAVGAGTQVLDRHGAGGLRLWRATLHFDEAHAAIAGHGQAFVVAEARDFRAGGFRGLHEGVVVRDFDECAVYFDGSHRLTPPQSTARRRRWSRTRYIDR